MRRESRISPMAREINIKNKPEWLAFLNSSFKSPELEAIYQHYLLQKRRRSTVLVLAAVTIVNALLIVVTVLRYATGIQKRINIARISVAGPYLLLACLTLAVVWRYWKSTNVFHIVPLVTWACIYVQVVVELTASEEMLCHDGVMEMMFFIYITYSVITFRFYACIALSLVITITHVIITIMRTQKPDSDEQSKIILQIVANILLYVATNVLGAINHVVAEANGRKSFLETREAIGEKFNFDKEESNQRRLLESILPPTLAQKIINDMRQTAYTESENFKKIYIQNHKNCSILFADIVGFTEYSSTVTAEQLIVMLNELFANFDKIGKRHSCQRIKILGDCYYCISGIEQEDISDDPHKMNHAENSVEMGLSMVEQIITVRKKTKVQALDMRVGIHSGHVLAGILGLKKWQFDVWSNDVTLANKMESGGLPGKVHVSASTYELIKDSYEVEEGDGRERCDYLKKNDITTYLIKSPKNGITEKRASMVKKVMEVFKKKTGDGDAESILRSVSRISNGFLRRSNRSSKQEMSQVLRTVDDVDDETEEIEIDEEEHINSMFFETLKNHKTRIQGVANSFTLHFYNKATEKEYYNSKRPYRILSVFCLLIVLFFDFFIKTTLMDMNIIIGVIFAVNLIILVCLILLISYVNQSSKISRLRVVCPTVKSRQKARVCDIISFTGVMCILLADILHCIFLKDEFTSKNIFYFAFTGKLMILAIPAMIQLSYLAKMTALVSVWLSFYLLGVTAMSNTLDSFPQDLAIVAVKHAMPIVSLFYLIIIFVHVRQSEWSCRSLMLWKKEAFDNREGVENLRIRNEKLMQNILPTHVIQHFLKSKSNDETDLYSRSYSNVGVIFASIPNFSSFYTEESFNQGGIECMRVLNEIISDFDEVLMEPEFCLIEKIKTVNSTYMAASGLVELTKRHATEDPYQHLVNLLNFALAMKYKLDLLNEQSFNNFQLRVGLSHGPVVAGVIGAKKPHYDIWGNTVNIASRMDSTGEPGKIQLLVDSKDILEARGFEFKSRGYVFVKGKGRLLTYLYVEHR